MCVCVCTPPSGRRDSQFKDPIATEKLLFITSVAAVQWQFVLTTGLVLPEDGTHVRKHAENVPLTLY